MVKTHINKIIQAYAPKCQILTPIDRFWSVFMLLVNSKEDYYFKHNVSAM